VSPRIREPCPPRTLPDTLGRHLHHRRNRARLRNAGLLPAVGAAEIAKVRKGKRSLTSTAGPRGVASAMPFSPPNCRPWTSI
jgi:hypothetical protein